MLRRLKGDVMNLPAKKEVDLYVPLSELQQKLYCHIMRCSRKTLEALNIASLMGTIMQVNAPPPCPVSLFAFSVSFAEPCSGGVCSARGTVQWRVCYSATQSTAALN